MRHAHSTFPWFLALILSSLSACDDLFSVPACEFDSNSNLCMQQKDGMGEQVSNDMAMGPEARSDMKPALPSNPPAMFKKITASDLNQKHKFVGVNSENFILFSDRSNDGSVNISSNKLEHTPPVPPMTEQWNLVSRSCAACIKMAIYGIDFNADKILASKTLFFVVKPYYAYLLTLNGTLVGPINNMGILAPNYRPFVSPLVDLIAYQKQIDAQSSVSEINYYSTPTEGKATAVTSRTSAPTTTYFAIGDLDGSGMKISDNEMLIFEKDILNGAYRMDDFPNTRLDQELTKAIGDAIRSVSGVDNTDPIRSAAIADFNNDGYAELIFARHQQIYITSYNPNGTPGSKFTKWDNSGFVNNEIERTETLSVVDLNDDGYLDLVIETHNPDKVYFYLNNK